MVMYNIRAFSGAAPRIAKNLLNDNEAQEAINAKLDNGELKSWQKPNALTSPVTYNYSPISMYRNKLDTWSVPPSGANFETKYLESPVKQSNNKYITLINTQGTNGGVISAKVYDNTGAAQYNKEIPLSCPGPAGGLTISLTGSGSGTAESRTYIYTFVCQIGDILMESPTSPASNIVDVQTGHTVNISDAVDPDVGYNLPDFAGAQGWDMIGGLGSAPTGFAYTGYNVVAVRLYRSVAGTTSRSFLFVKEVAVDQATNTTAFGTDTVAANALGEVCPAIDFAYPETGYGGFWDFAIMPNGILVGVHDSTISFSDSYQIHAYPTKFQLTVDSTIVGLGVIGSSVVILTEEHPYIATGIDPSNMVLEKLPLVEPCANRRSIVTDSDSVMYASPNGIIKIRPGAINNITRNIFSYKQWQAFDPTSMHGNYADGKYYLFYKNTTTSTEGGLIFDSFNKESPYSSITTYASATYYDASESKFYILDTLDNNIKQWDNSNPDYLTFEWKSKQFESPSPVNFGSAISDADYSNIDFTTNQNAYRASVQASNQALFTAGTDLGGEINDNVLNYFTLNGSVLQDLPPSVDPGFVLLQVYGDDALIGSTYFTSYTTARLPSGYKAQKWEFVISGNIPVRSVKIAESSNELRKV